MPTIKKRVLDLIDELLTGVLNDPDNIGRRN